MLIIVKTARFLNYFYENNDDRLIILILNRQYYRYFLFLRLNSNKINNILNETI